MAIENPYNFDVRSQIVEVHCRKCGKIFVPAPYHVYKDNRGFYCTWTCYNHRNDGVESMYREVEQCNLDGEVVRTFQSANKAGEYIGKNASAAIIRKACKEGKMYKGYLWRYKT